MQRRGFLKVVAGLAAAIGAVSRAGADSPPVSLPPAAPCQPKTVTVFAHGTSHRIGVLYPDGYKEVLVIRADDVVIDPSTFEHARRVFLDSMTMYRASYICNLTTGEVIKSRFNDITYVPDFNGLVPSEHARYMRSVNYES